jgi:hypothetical protein
MIQLSIGQFETARGPFQQVMLEIAPSPQCILRFDPVLSTRGLSTSLRISITTFAAYLPYVCPQVKDPSVFKAKLESHGLDSSKYGQLEFGSDSTTQCAVTLPSPNLNKTCLPGQEIVPGQDQCTLCSPGTFSSAPGLERCLSCSQGKFTPLSGATGCGDCAGSTAKASTTCDPPAEPSLFDRVEVLGGLIGGGVFTLFGAIFAAILRWGKENKCITPAQHATMMNCLRAVNCLGDKQSDGGDGNPKQESTAPGPNVTAPPENARGATVHVDIAIEEKRPALHVEAPLG